MLVQIYLKDMHSFQFQALITILLGGWQYHSNPRTRLPLLPLHRIPHRQWSPPGTAGTRSPGQAEFS